MIQEPIYRNRQYKQLLSKLKEAQNTLQMRDWQIDLEVGDTPPKRFIDKDNGDSVCRAWYDTTNLKAHIWISPARCKKENTDPLFNLYHEIGHIWSETHNEETRCNIVASLLIE